MGLWIIFVLAFGLFLSIGSILNEDPGLLRVGLIIIILSSFILAYEYQDFITSL